MRNGHWTALGLQRFSEPYRRFRDAKRTAESGTAPPVVWGPQGEPGAYPIFVRRRSLAWPAIAIEYARVVGTADVAWLRVVGRLRRAAEQPDRAPGQCLCQLTTPSASPDVGLLYDFTFRDAAVAVSDETRTTPRRTSMFVS